MTDIEPVARRGGRAKGRGYSWPTATQGNTIAVRHGIRSERLVTAETQRVVETAVESLPWLADPEHHASVMAWARAEAIVRMLANWLAEAGVFDDEGKPRRDPLEQLRAFERLAAERRSELGLSPTAKAKLRRDLAAGTEDLADAFAKLQRGGEAS